MDGGSNFGGKREKGDSEKGENRLLNGRGLKQGKEQSTIKNIVVGTTSCAGRYAVL